MATDTVTEAQETTEDERTLRHRLPTLLLIVGALSAIATLALWWLGTIPDEAHPEVGRTIFENVPGVFVAMFYVVISALIFVSAYLFAQRARSWARGQDEDRTRMLKQRIHELREGLAMKTLLREPGAGLMHAAIYYGFIVLFLGTVTLEIDHLLPNNLKFLEGGVYQGYSFVLDGFALVSVGRSPAAGA